MHRLLLRSLHHALTCDIVAHHLDLLLRRIYLLRCPSTIARLRGKDPILGKRAVKRLLQEVFLVTLHLVLFEGDARGLLLILVAEQFRRSVLGGWFSILGL